MVVLEKTCIDLKSFCFNRMLDYVCERESSCFMEPLTDLKEKKELANRCYQFVIEHSENSDIASNCNVVSEFIDLVLNQEDELDECIERGDGEIVFDYLKVQCLM